LSHANHGHFLGPAAACLYLATTILALSLAFAGEVLHASQ
jgi:hypothetical protein